MRYQWQPRQTSFHLRALAGLVEHESSTGKYQLTDAGQMAISLIEDFQFLAEKTRQMKLGAPVNYVRNLALGDHSLLLYDAETFKREISFSFLKEGLSKHQAALYIVSENKLDSENRQVEKHGITFHQIHSGAFTILPSEELYLRKGKAHAKTIIANWLELAKEKQTAGFEGLCVAAETRLILRKREKQRTTDVRESAGPTISVHRMCDLPLQRSYT